MLDQSYPIPHRGRLRRSRQGAAVVPRKVPHPAHHLHREAFEVHLARLRDSHRRPLQTKQIVEWFEADAKRKREEAVNAAVLKWQSEG